MKKIQVSLNKTLVLRNAVKYKVDFGRDDLDIDMYVRKMQNYILINGNKQIGPLIQHTKPFVNENNELDMEIFLIMQADNFIHNVEQPYIMDSIIKIPNCMYCRYVGPEDKLNFAYQKIQLEAFENDISLKGDSYTVFVDRVEENDTITADVFMERED